MKDQYDDGPAIRLVVSDGPTTGTTTSTAGEDVVTLRDGYKHASLHLVGSIECL